MALITPLSSITIDTTSAMTAPKIPASLGLVAGEDLLGGAPCYIKASDNKIYMSNGTSANEAAEVDGFTPRPYTSGEPVTLYGRGSIFEYAASGLTPGAVLYVGATKGRLDDSSTTGDTVGVARTINATHIRVIRDS